jgi:hypothetical protein
VLLNCHAGLADSQALGVPHLQPASDILPGCTGTLAQLTQLSSLSLAYNKYAADKAAVSALVAVPIKMHRLQAFEIDFEYRCGRAAQESPGPANLESKISVWDSLCSADP